MEDGERVKRERPEARNSAPIGTAHGLHLPGILPEPDVIESQGEEWTDKEKEVLRDLEGAMAEGDREEPYGEAALRDSSATPVALPRQRAQLPWWYGTVTFAVASVGLLAAGFLSDGTFALRLGFVVAGIALAWLSVQSWRNRARPSG